MTRTRRGARRSGATIAAALAVVGVVGCSSDDTTTSAPDTTARDTATTSLSTTAGGTTGATVALSKVRVRATDLDLDLDSAIDVAVRPNSSSLLVAERGGAVREAVADGSGFRLADEPVIDISDLVGSTDSERGLLGIAVAPAGDRLYLSYTEAGRGDSRIDEFELSGRDGSLRADPDSARTLVGITQPFPNHNGGSLRFGPDGMLWAGFGDGGDADDPDGRAQDRSTLLGKVLRLDPSAPDSVPTDNPFVDDGGLPLIWATGLRNPWRISFDRATGDLWIGDVGQNEWEEVDVLRVAGGTGRGANLGWDLFEGESRFSSPDPADGAASAGPFTEPVHVYSHDDGCSITGGVVVRDPRLADLDGAYLFGDFCTPGVRAIRVDDGRTVDRADLGITLGSVVSFAEGPGGEVYVVSLDAGISRLDPA